MNLTLDTSSTRRTGAELRPSNSTSNATPTSLATQRARDGDLAEHGHLFDAERQPCEVWTRVMGYHRPVASFNTGKQAEHAERRFFEAAVCVRA